MKSIRWLNSFKRDYRRIIRRLYQIERLHAITDVLRRSDALPFHSHPHPLRGEWKGYWECHISGDWLLVYKVTDTEVILARTGTHADIFKE